MTATEALISLSVLGVCGIGVLLVVEFGVRVQKWLMFERTLRKRDRQFAELLKRQERRKAERSTERWDDGEYSRERQRKEEGQWRSRVQRKN